MMLATFEAVQSGVRQTDAAGESSIRERASLLFQKARQLLIQMPPHPFKLSELL